MTRTSTRKTARRIGAGEPAAPHRIAALTALFLLTFGIASPARATDGPIFLFGGPDLGEFLGCLNCYRSEAFSVWNESGEFGSPSSPLSIWNRHGEFGSVGGNSSPWNPSAPHPPVAVDRVGNLYGYFTRNPVHPERVLRNPGHPYAVDFDLLAWLLENYDWVVTHLDEMRERY